MKQEIIDSLMGMGWIVSCASPLELTKTDGSVMRGDSATTLVAEVESQSVELSVCASRLATAREALQLIFGDQIDRCYDEPSSRQRQRRPHMPYTTKEERQERAVKERQICEFLTEYSNQRVGPPHIFTRIADTEGMSLGVYGLDAISDDGHYIVDIREASYTMDSFDDMMFHGCAITDWKIECARIACGCPGAYAKRFPRDGNFQSALFIYCDAHSDIFQISLNRIMKLLRYMAQCRLDDIEHPRPTYGYFKDSDNPCWFVPSCYWQHLGNLTKDGMERFRSARDHTEIP